MQPGDIMSIFKREEVISTLDKKYWPLFYAFKKTKRYEEKGMDQKINILKNSVYYVLSKEDLEAIENLIINNETDLSFLNKIDELCPNLRSLTIATPADTYTYKSWKEKLYEAKNNEERQKLIEYLYGQNKLTDENMYHIQKLTKLEELRIPSQTQITKLDFSKMPNLTIVLAKNCINVKEIKGMNDNLFKENYATFDFTGCEKLDNETFKMFSNLFDINHLAGKELSPGHLFLPHGCSIKKENDLSHFVDFTKAIQGDTVLFSQSTNGLLINHYAKDIEKYRAELDKIIATVCNPNKTDMKNITALYNWVTSSINYDHATAKKESENWEEINQSEVATREASKNRSEKARSGIYTLKKQLGVCAGISEVFGDLVTRANFKSVEYSRQVLCSTKPSKPGFLTPCNHQMCSIKFKGAGEYYFDPTNDLECIPPTLFAMNKESVLKKYSLSFRENNVKNAPSLFNRSAISIAKHEMEM